jgi:hypothetical protein
MKQREVVISKIFIIDNINGSADFCWDLAAFSVFIILHTIGRTPWTGDQPVARPLPAHRTTQT